MKKCLVTGGAGFIGSNLVDHLLSNGHEVIVVDNESSNSHDEYYWNDACINFKFDLSFGVNLNRLISICTGVDYIFHLASDVSIPYCIQKPHSAYLNNVASLSYVLEAARFCQVEKVVFSSTAAIYGMTNSVCVETAIPDPLNPYSVSKLSGEYLMKMYYDLYNVKTVSLRYFNVYGPRQPETGQYAPVMGIFLKQRNEGKALTVVGDGLQTRDFIHVSDIAAANIMVAEKDAETYGQVYNVGTGNATSVDNIAKLISDRIEYLPPRLAEARHSLSNINKIKNTYGWNSSIRLDDWIGEQL
jgi:nucleoside-diphosphate-sugar epimerase